MDRDADCHLCELVLTHLFGDPRASLFEFAVHCAAPGFDICAAMNASIVCGQYRSSFPTRITGTCPSRPICRAFS
jgi:hypothetical protein